MKTFSLFCAVLLAFCAGAVEYKFELKSDKGPIVKVGDEVTILGKNGDNEIFVCDMALWCDTISYEILTRFSKRIKRVYKKVEDADYNRKV